MVLVTKEQSSFRHLFKIKGGIPRDLSVEFDLMQDKSRRISKLEAGLSAEGFKRSQIILVRRWLWRRKFI